jgi:hypothetical protein
MNQHSPALNRTLVVRTSFEPSHVAAACTADAYEYIVPYVQRPLPHRRPSRPEVFSTRAKPRVAARREDRHEQPHCCHLCPRVFGTTQSCPHHRESTRGAAGASGGRWRFPDRARGLQ